MNKKTKVLLIAAAVLAVAGAAGGYYVWSRQPAGKGVAVKPVIDYKYVSLDKVLVMLRGDNGEAVPHYMALDLVFKVVPDEEAHTKAHLPLLRTIAVRAMSVNTVKSAMSMSIDQVAQSLNAAYAQSYREDGHKPPFAEALVGKLIIE